MKLFGKGNPEEPQPEEPQPEEAPAGDMHNEIQPDSRVEATVRRAGEGAVTMYRDGIPVAVPADQAGHFQSLGFLLHAPADLPGLKSEIISILTDLGPKLDQFVEAVLRDEVIDPVEEGELHVLTRSWNMADQKLQQLLGVVHQVYPVRERSADPE